MKSSSYLWAIRFLNLLVSFIIIGACQMCSAKGKTDSYHSEAIYLNKPDESFKRPV